MEDREVGGKVSRSIEESTEVFNEVTYSLSLHNYMARPHHPRLFSSYPSHKTLDVSMRCDVTTSPPGMVRFSCFENLSCQVEHMNGTSQWSRRPAYEGFFGILWDVSLKRKLTWL